MGFQFYGFSFRLNDLFKLIFIKISRLIIFQISTHKLTRLALLNQAFVRFIDTTVQV